MLEHLHDTRSTVIRALRTEEDLAQALAQRGLPPDADLWDLLRHERSAGHLAATLAGDYPGCSSSP